MYFLECIFHTDSKYGNETFEFQKFWGEMKIRNMSSAVDTYVERGEYREIMPLS